MAPSLRGGVSFLAREGDRSGVDHAARVAEWGARIGRGRPRYASNTARCERLNPRFSRQAGRVRATDTHRTQPLARALVAMPRRAAAGPRVARPAFRSAGAAPRAVSVSASEANMPSRVSRLVAPCVSNSTPSAWHDSPRSMPDPRASRQRPRDVRVFRRLA